MPAGPYDDGLTDTFDSAGIDNAEPPADFGNSGEIVDSGGVVEGGGDTAVAALDSAARVIFNPAWDLGLGGGESSTASMGGDTVSATVKQSGTPVFIPQWDMGGGVVPTVRRGGTVSVGVGAGAPARVSSPPRLGPKELAVVVVCHAGYLDFLPQCLASIARQTGDVTRILVLDNCEYDAAPEGWEVLNGVFGTPNPGRNMGWRRAAALGAKWVIFWDADNLMGAGYLWTASQGAAVAERSTGVLSPDVIRQDTMGQRFSLRQPVSRDFWSGRERSLSDTSSVWRMEALYQAGGFPEGNVMLDDYILALRATDLGWRVEPLNAPVLLTDHDTNRSKASDRGEADLWHNRTFHIVTLLAGRDTVLSHWNDAAQALELPPNTHITLVDDSGREVFGIKARLAASSLALRPEVRSARVIKAPPKTEAAADWLSIHRRVAMLYNLALAGQDHDMTLMWEDDVIPTDTKSLRMMHEGFLPFTQLAGVGGIYPSRENDKVAVASMDALQWKGMPLLSALSDWQARETRHRFGMIGGGFTLWAGHFLARALPLQPSPELSLGWDGSLSRELGRQGCSLELDLRVWADHLTNV